MDRRRPQWGIQVLASLLAAACLPAVALELPGVPNSSGAEAGFAVAIDGVRVAFGAPGEASTAGAAYVGDCASLPCATAVRVRPSGLQSRDLYGSAVALSADTLAVGAPGDREGAVYIFVASGGNWLQQAKLRAFDGRNNDRFGIAIALQGNRLVVGANGADDNRGAVYVFARSGTAWALDARMQPAGLAEETRFGSAVALSGDTLAAGAPWQRGALVGDWGRGAAWVYVRGANWTQQAQLGAADAANGGQFGFSLGLENDRLLVGAPGAVAQRGSAYVFQRVGSAWSQTAQLAAVQGASGHGFGWSVALDGDSLLIGAPFTAAADAACGRIHAFDLALGNWSEVPPTLGLLPTPRETTGFALARRNGRIAVGSPGRDRSAVLLTGGADWFNPAIQLFDNGYDEAQPACQPALR